MFVNILNAFIFIIYLRPFVRWFLRFYIDIYKEFMAYRPVFNDVDMFIILEVLFIVHTDLMAQLLLNTTDRVIAISK